MYTYIIHNITNGSNTFRKGTANPQIIAQSYFEGTAGFTRYIFNIYILLYSICFYICTVHSPVDSYKKSCVSYRRSGERHESVLST